MVDLFKNDSVSVPLPPLADRLRPRRFDDYIGQEHLLGNKGILRQMLAATNLSSLVFWGPPGVGKTTLARILTREVNWHFQQISAIFSGVVDLKRIFKAAQQRKKMGQKTLLFVDEIHRFNKAQQDSFLPYIENGTVVLIGATTENPSFELNSALLSRVQVLVLHRLTLKDLELIAQRAEKILNVRLLLDIKARQALLEMADGDGRSLLNLIEQCFSWQLSTKINTKTLGMRLSKRLPNYDKKGDSHYNLISALHKSVRGSDPDAALYWLARMLDAGEDRHYLARRITRIAVEDIGLADTNAQALCLQAWQIYERLGSPEGELALAQAVLYLALSPKSNAAYQAFKKVKYAAQKTGTYPPPKHILNAPTNMMKQQGYGDGYIYDHDTVEGFSGQNYFPDNMPRQVYYVPVNRGGEREMKKRLVYFSKLRAHKDK